MVSAARNLREFTEDNCQTKSEMQINPLDQSSLLSVWGFPVLSLVRENRFPP